MNLSRQGMTTRKVDGLLVVENIPDLIEFTLALTNDVDEL